MVYVKSITTGYTTDAYTESVTALKLTKGVIRQAEIYFPPGCCGLLQAQILLNDKAYIPFNGSELLIGDSLNLVYNDNTLITDEPYQIKIITRNYDNLYNHLLQVRFIVKTLAEITSE